MNNMAKFNHIKDLYEDGYRCIYYDCAQNNHTVYLKNFKKSIDQYYLWW